MGFRPRRRRTAAAKMGLAHAATTWRVRSSKVARRGAASRRSRAARDRNALRALLGARRVEDLAEDLQLLPLERAAHFLRHHLGGGERKQRADGAQQGAAASSRRTPPRPTTARVTAASTIRSTRRSAGPVIGEPPGRRRTAGAGPPRRCPRRRRDRAQLGDASNLLPTKEAQAPRSSRISYSPSAGRRR